MDASLVPILTHQSLQDVVATADWTKCIFLYPISLHLLLAKHLKQLKQPQFSLHCSVKKDMKRKEIDVECL